MIPGKNNPVCIDCGLWKSCNSPFMEPDGSKKPKVLIIGEAPGEEEDTQGRPFVGRSGTLLRSAIEGVGFDKDDVLYTNIVRCRPEDNKISKVAIEHCKIFAIKEIELYKPSITLLMGNSPLEGILGESGITSWNGISITREDKKYMPLYHPAYILRNQSVMDEWLTAMLSIDEKIDGNVDDNPRYDTTIIETISQLEAMREELNLYEFVSFDAEVSALNPYYKNCKLLTVSFGVPGIVYAAPVDHKDSWFIRNKLVKEIIAGVLSDHSEGVIGHNLKFDQMHAYKHLGVEFFGHGDTMLISHLLDSRHRATHGLKHLAGMYAGMYDYDSELRKYVKSHKEADPAKGGSYDNVPLKILLPYNAADAEATVKVYQKLYVKLTDEQKTLHNEMIMSLSDMLCEVQINGMMLDKGMVDFYTCLYDLIRDDQYDFLQQNRYVKKLISYHKSNKKFMFNTNSPLQMAELYFDICNIPVLEYTKTGNRSTKSKTYRKYEDKFPILHEIRMHKLFGKMLSTYLRPSADKWLSNDGRVRSSYNLNGAVTGRISSTDPNLQNIPTPEKEPGTLLEYKPIKNIFTHSYVDWKASNYVDRYCHGVLMSADYSGMELRVFASLAKCYPMIDIHKSGKDFHSCIAIKLMTHKQIEDITLEEIKKLPKGVRYRYKWTNWTLLFGGGAETLVSMYDIDERDAKTAVREYYDEFPEVLELRRDTIEFARTHGYVESPFGRREYLPDIDSNDGKRRARAEREAINMPTQSGSSDTTLCAGYIVNDKLKIGELKSKLVNTVHDSILLDVPRYEIRDAAERCKYVMENIKEIKDAYFPNISFDWLICPLKVDIEIGTHYGAELSVDEWEALYG